MHDMHHCRKLVLHPHVNVGSSLRVEPLTYEVVLEHVRTTFYVWQQILSRQIERYSKDKEDMLASILAAREEMRVLWDLKCMTLRH